MKLSVQTGSILSVLRPESAEPGFRMIKEAGFDYVDFNIDHLIPGSNIWNGILEGYCEGSDEELREMIRPFKEAAARHGVGFNQAHAPFPTYMAGNDAMNAYVFDSLLKSIMVCGYVGCPYIIVHPGIFDRSLPGGPEAEWEYNMTMYRSLIPALKEYGVVCCLENMFTVHKGRIIGATCSDPAEAIAYIDALNAEAGEKRFGFCLDVGHTLVSGQDIGRFVSLLGDRLVTTHIHDNDGNDDQHLAPYMGRVDWDRFCAAMAAIGFDKVMSFETFNTLNTFPEPLWPSVLRLIAETGAMFAARIGNK